MTSVGLSVVDTFNNNHVKIINDTRNTSHYSTYVGVNTLNLKEVSQCHNIVDTDIVHVLCILFVTHICYLSTATQEIVWIRRLLSDLTATQGQATVLMEDNQGAICIAKNPVLHARTKHIDVRYHYVREAVSDGVINLQYCPTHEMVADILTKPLPKKRFEALRTNMGLTKSTTC